MRLFERIEVGALHVLDDRELERFLVVDLADDDRHFVQPGPLRRAPAAFAGDDLENVRILARPHQQRLHHALFADRIGQLFELVRIEIAARIGAVGDDEFDRQLLDAAAALGDARRLRASPCRRSARPGRGPDVMVYRSWSGLLMPPPAAARGG